MKSHDKIQKMVLAALFLALAYVLPFLTGQIREIGAMLCPMHLPVLICGFICGWPWGLVIGFTAPLFRSLTLGIPRFFPTAISMALELATYGAVSALMHKVLRRRRLYIWCSLLTAMVAGRLVWGASMLVLLSLSGSRFPFQAFLAGAVLNALPGILVQLVLVPILIMLLDDLALVKRKN